MRKVRIISLEGRENCYSIKHNCWVKNATIYYTQNKKGTYTVMVDWEPFAYKTEIIISTMDDRGKELIKETLGLNTYYYSGFKEIRWIRI